MTIERFRAEYQLLDRVSDGTVETHHAQAAAGVMVMVHFLRGTESQNATILERIERLETERRQKVLRTIDVDGVTAVVTRFILDLTSFEDWLGLNATPADLTPSDTPPAEGSIMSEASATTPSVPPADGPAPERADAAPGASEPGEFTMLFRAPAPPPDPASPVPSPPGETREPEPDRPAASPEQTPSPSAREPEPGEFTRVFAMPAEQQSTPNRTESEPTIVRPRPTVEPPPSVAPTPLAGSSTPAATRPPPAAAPPVAPTLPPSSEPPPPFVTPPPSAAPPPAALPFRPAGPSMPEIGLPRTSKPGEPGEYTRMVNPHLIPGPPSRSDRRPTFPGLGADQPVGGAGAVQRPRYDIDNYRERLAAPSSGASPFPPPPPAAPLPPPPAAPTGPGEFTRVIESMPTPNLGQPSPSSSTPPPPRPKPPPASNKLLVLALLGVVVAAVLFVVIFAILT